MKPPTKKAVRAMAMELHGVGLAAIREDEGYNDGVNKTHAQWPRRVRVSLEAIARHVLSKKRL